MRVWINKINAQLHYYMAFPAILLFGLFFLYPLAQGVGISLTDSNGITAPNFIGFENFIQFFEDDRARNGVLITILFAMGSAPLLNLFGLSYALILDRKFPLKGLIRVIVYLPAVISPLIMGYIWYFILQPERGYLAYVLKKIGLGELDVNWLGESSSALVVLVIVNVWQYVGMTMIVYLAGLQGIPFDLYEAATIDGAGRSQALRFITLPLLYPAIKINVVTNIIGSLSVFEIIIALTDGGPGYATESLSIYILRMLYGSFTGYSTAVALILFVIILIPVALFLRMSRKSEYEL
jgi:raffinose/stachyose/melibiose transport system permease protein